MSFNVGDMVQLKSGGPHMTITRIGIAGGETMLWCAWFEGTRDAYALFPPDALKAAAEPPVGVRTPSEPQPMEVDSAPVTPEAIETAPNPHPIQADSAPPVEEHEKSQEATIVSIQSLIAGLLKRPNDQRGED